MHRRSVKVLPIGIAAAAAVLVAACGSSGGAASSSAGGSSSASRAPYVWGIDAELSGPVSVYGDQIASGVQWRSGMGQLAACPNAVVKVGGIGMDSYFFRTGWSSRARPLGSDDVVAWWGDDICWCIDTFGPSRCMFESNYPVDRDAVGYTVLWNAFQKIAATYSADEQDDLFAGTAARVYRIALDGETTSN